MALVYRFCHPPLHKSKSVTQKKMKNGVNTLREENTMRYSLNTIFHESNVICEFGRRHHRCSSSSFNATENPISFGSFDLQLYARVKHHIALTCQRAHWAGGYDIERERARRKYARKSIRQNRLLSNDDLILGEPIFEQIAPRSIRRRCLPPAPSPVSSLHFR